MLTLIHDQDSGYSFHNAVHQHLEMDIALGFTRGFEVWVFDYGK